MDPFILLLVAHLPLLCAHFFCTIIIVFRPEASLLLSICFQRHLNLRWFRKSIDTCRRREERELNKEGKFLIYGLMKQSWSRVNYRTVNIEFRYHIKRFLQFFLKILLQISLSDVYELHCLVHRMTSHYL